MGYERHTCLTVTMWNPSKDITVILQALFIHVKFSTLSHLLPIHAATRQKVNALELLFLILLIYRRKETFNFFHLKNLV